MAGNLTDVPRAERLDIVRNLLAALVSRQQSGAPEPALDAFIPELEALLTGLESRPSGDALGDALRAGRLARAELAEVDVDTWLRHIESFLLIEASRRRGKHLLLARDLFMAACPDGLSHIDVRVVEQNAHARETLAVLKAPESAAAIVAVELPTWWITKLEAAIIESEAAITEVIASSSDRSSGFSLDRDPEDEWVDVMLRLRKYLGARARRTDFVRIIETRTLFRPLLDALQKMRAEAAARDSKRTVKLHRSGREKVDRG